MKASVLKENLSVEQIMDLMEHLGADHINSNGATKYIQYRTICHCGDSHKLYFYLDSKEFHCYSNCGQLDIISIVQNVKNLNFLAAKQYIETRYGISQDSEMHIGEFAEEEDSEDWSILNREYVQAEVDTERNFNVINESVLRRFYKMYHPCFYNDGISIETLHKFGIMYDILNRRVIIPHREEEGKLIAIRCRNLDEDLIKDNKYMPIVLDGVLLSARTSSYFYGMYYNKDKIRRMKKVILVESEKAVMQMEEILGEENNIALALSSSSISLMQVRLLEELGVEEVVIAVDKDYHEYGSEEEKLNAMKVRKAIINKLLGHFSISVIWDKEGLLGYKDSPTDKGAEVFFKLYERRIRI